MEARPKQVVAVRLALFVGVVVAAAILATSCARIPAGEPHLTQLVPLDLVDGDLVFRRGIDAVSRIALSYGDQPRFSHVGMVVRVGGSATVVHAVPRDFTGQGGVRSDPLEQFVAPYAVSDVGYLRVDALSVDQRAQARRYLMQALGSPFDYEFRYSDDTALYCTELVVKALESAGLAPMLYLHTVTGVTLSEPAIPPDALLGLPSLRVLMPNYGYVDASQTSTTTISSRD